MIVYLKYACVASAIMVLCSDGVEKGESTWREKGLEQTHSVGLSSQKLRNSC